MIKPLFILISWLLSLEAYPKDTHPECQEWFHDGECVTNPRYLWSHCQTSCGNSKDVDDECEKWAEEGECSANPSYVATRCHDSCGNALSWNPYLRRKMNLDTLTAEDVSFSCPMLSSIIHAATLTHERLKTLFYGGYAIKNIGFALDAPSDYLGMMGICEAQIYTMRLYAIIIDNSGNQELQNIQGQRMRRVLDIAGAGYDADFLMRHLMPIMEILFRAQNDIKTLYDNADDIFASLDNLCSMNSQPLIPYIIHSGIVPVDKISTNIQVVGGYLKLYNGIELPSIGLGTWQLEGDECEQAVFDAIEIGYRHIDSAEAYRNEIQVGRGIKRAIDAGLVSRSDLFIATKLSNEDNAGYDKVKIKVAQQLRDLQLDYLDLYMLHSPISDKEIQRVTWKALEEMHAAGTIRALGVSNFNGEELRKLIAVAEISPMVIQNKFDIYHLGKQLDHTGDDVYAYAKSLGIIMVAYSSFSAYPFSMIPTHDPIVNFVALRQPAPVTPAQV
jgi:diketogulonate reductase-like aldo/keto reductase